MKKITIPLLFLLTILSVQAQELDQPANWPNNLWSITGTYLNESTVFEADPRTSANFAYDDDDAGGGHDDDIHAESPVINLTDANNAGETWITVNTSYVFNSLGELLRLQYWDADASSWTDWISYPGNTNSINDNFCSGNHIPANSDPLDISGFTATQLSGFRYRLSYDDNGIFGWGFCFDSPTISSQTPPACPNVSELNVTNITLTSASVYWDAGASETSWEIVVQAPGTGIPAGSGIATSTNNPHSLNGLTESTSFEVYVRGYCGGTDFSNWIGPVNFTTLAPSRVNFSQISTPMGGYDLCVVDMDGDHLDDIVSVSSTNVKINFQLPGGGFNEQNFSTPSASFMPTWSMAAGDFDEDGFTDLLYGNGSGVTFMKQNSDTSPGATDFEQISGSEYVFSQRSNFADINNDGLLDAFVCHDVDANVFYINDGSGGLTYYQGGLGEIRGNYGSIWIDYDNDGDLDMFIAKCGGGPINMMLTNNGDGTYIENAAALGLADGMQTWSSSWGDYDKDGDMDLYIGASSGSHKLMQNNIIGTGSYIFTDVTSGSGISGPLGHENVSYDFDNDGFLDIAGNGTIMYGRGDLTFEDVDGTQLNYKNGSFGDLNNDGFIDTYYNGTRYMNTGNSNNWIKINTVGTISNLDGIGARVELHTASGVQIRDVRSGEGFEFMSSLNTHFGIGSETDILQIIVRWPTPGLDGEPVIDIINNPSINQTLTITEGDNALSVQNEEFSDLSIHPNPVNDFLNINTAANLINRNISVFDISGKTVINQKLKSNVLNVSQLQSGVYILKIESDGKLINRKFIKQ